jgi:thiol-disulfide isomerase/thioredoxin
MSHAIVLYGKPGCHLCDIAEELLLGLRREFQFTLQKIDINTDPALAQEFGTRIPVVIIDGRTTLDAPIRTAAVRAALADRATG